MTSKSLGIALVTGAARGIGKGIALRLASDGFDVAINDLPNSKELLDTLSQEIQDKYGRKSCTVLADVSLESDVENMVSYVVQELGRLDVMVANAGIMLVKPMLSTTAEEWDRLFSINARSVFLCYKYAGQQMVAQGGGGRIIGASSSAGKQGDTNVSAYSSTKFAVRGLTQSAALELGPHGITVNAYAPGAIDTPLLQNFAGDNPTIIESEAKRSVVGHIGKPEDVADLVSFLASKESSFITGQSVSVNGGRFFD